MAAYPVPLPTFPGGNRLRAGKKAKGGWMVQVIGRRCIIPAICLLPGACATGSSDTIVTAPTVTACEDPRPQICTMDYRPVCATLDNGSVKTYSNGCGACADIKASSWIDGACPE